MSTIVVLAGLMFLLRRSGKRRRGRGKPYVPKGFAD